MEPAILTAIIASVASLVVALVSARMARQGQKELAQLQQQAAQVEREVEAEQVLSRYRQPLTSAAYDLQSRLRNILANNFVGNYAKGESERQLDAIHSTLFRLAQYFAWTEILRQEIQFLDLREPEKTRSVSELQRGIARAFASDDYGKEFMLWIDEQRGIGEMMISRAEGHTRSLGYATFSRNYESEASRWLQRFEKDLTSDRAPQSQRLEEIQHLLCQLIRKLDPEGLYDDSALQPATRQTG
jgi:hypothetical protein